VVLMDSGGDGAYLGIIAKQAQEVGLSAFSHITIDVEEDARVRLFGAATVLKPPQT